MPREGLDSFCKSVYALGFVDCRLPMAGAEGEPADTVTQEQERICNSIQQYFGDMYEDPEQV